ncbi:MAG: carotenoid oxygenase family protein [Gomphosphaeria aponina SAG 52.96 = DSM 107014]|uniref:Carotenoid oxygenase family protein n=1 Tax=Gomphosphaeria aponina SAG 52.96 = DSM 107014 TaxID=1521640 RepID=A0A941GVA8_9CHRO|nr:carotenoid oxygenase family protein [Gomphosphaeria aponina SAG 52.96 = DSM 107014]
MENLLIEKSPIPSYNREEWKRGYDSQPNEYDYWVDDMAGEIPAAFNGTLFRNGPGLLDIHGIPIKHPFDGDGMICAFTFKNGQCHFRNRFVRTEAYVAEQTMGKMLYRGVFGTAKPGGWLNNAFDLKLKNIANTNIIYWGGKLLALWEAAEPYSLNPATLETLGIDYLDGILQPGDAFAAHPRIDPSRNCLVNFAIKPGLSSKILVYELDSNGKLLASYDQIIPGFAFIHDFVITPNYCIFFQNPVGYNPFPYLFGFRGAGECVKFQDNKPTNIIVIPRQGKKVKILQVNAGFIFHHANAFEQGDNLYIDSICYQSLPQINPNTDYKEVDFDQLDPGQLWRFELNLKEETVGKTMVESRCCEFPTIHPEQVGKNYRYLFIGAAHNSTGNAPLQAILKLDLETGEKQLYSFAPHGYVSEPIFVPKPAAKTEDDGWVITLVYNGSSHRSEVVILDALDLNIGPLARLQLKHHIPYGLHGSWTGNCFI